MTIKLLTLTFLAAITSIQMQSCGPSRNSEKGDEVRKVFNLNSRVELMFFFKKGLSTASKDHFYENVLNQRHPDGGYWPRDGVKATFGIDRDGYEGFGFAFFPDATADQKRNLRKLLSDSQLIHKIYEDAVPNEINDL